MQDIKYVNQCVICADEVKIERAGDIQKGIMCGTSPWDTWHLRIDGTAQLPFGYPQFAEHTKACKESRLKVKLTIVQVPGLQVIFPALENIAGDPNLTVECLQRVLTKLEDQLGYLPKTISVQMDNCGERSCVCVTLCSRYVCPFYVREGESQHLRYGLGLHHGVPPAEVRCGESAHQLPTQGPHALRVCGFGVL